MWKSLFESLKNMNYKIFRIVNYGFIVSFLFCLVGMLLLLTYNTYPSSYDFYIGGIILFRTGISFVATFLCCGIVFNQLKKEV